MPAVELQGDTGMTPQPSYDWKTYAVSIPITGMSLETVLKNLEEEYRRSEERLREELTADIFADGAMGISLGEECFDAQCDHCGGYWDRLFATQEEADEWLAQHQGRCLELVPPSLHSPDRHDT